MIENSWFYRKNGTTQMGEVQTIKITSHWNGEVLYECQTASLAVAATMAAAAGVSLRGADFRWANLHKATLYRANLREAKLGDAVASEVNFCDADLTGADFRGAVLWRTCFCCAGTRRADFRDARLNGSVLNWASHELIAEILRQAAGDDVAKSMLAGLVAMRTDWCWPHFQMMTLTPEVERWALDTLSPYVRAGADTPDILRNYVEANAARQG